MTVRKASWRTLLTPARHSSGEGLRLVTPGGKVIARHVETAFSPWRRLRGLLGRTSMAESHALVLSPCAQVHTIGMRFAIDAVFCDEDLVVLAAQSLPPHRLSRAVRAARCCIELPAGTIQWAGIMPGSRLDLMGPEAESGDSSPIQESESPVPDPEWRGLGTDA